MNKTIHIIINIVFISFFLVACGNNEEVESPTPSETEVDEQVMENETASNDDTTVNARSDYGFKKFELDVDLQNIDDAIDVDYELENNNKVETSYKDKSKQIDLHGDAAMEKLDPIFSSFDFDENTNDEDVLQRVIDAFDIPDDAMKVEVEIDFNSGVEKEYRK